MIKKILLISWLVVVSAVFAADACTSMLVSAKMSATGRPLLWKHRDTGTEDNFVARMEAKDGGFGYVALYNGGDLLLREAWTGMNDAGFAIMNTASYNLAPDTAKLADQEGVVMAEALRTCQSVDDFQRLLDAWPRPMGIQANFGVMDADGGLAYFEAYDHGYTRFDVSDAEEGFLVRTNHSMTGNDTDGFGYIRYQNALDVLQPEIAACQLSPWAFTEKASKSFWHSLSKKDYENEGKWVIDQDFIPRNITSASLVIEGVNPGEKVEDICMWVAIGYTPCSSVQEVRLDSIPVGLLPTAEGYKSPDCNAVVERKRKAFPIHRGNGNKYIDMEYLRAVMPQMKEKSYKEYRKKYKNLIK